jgi:uncharacterized protein (TIGR03083 family)
MLHSRYLAVLESDGARLAEAARAAGLHRPIPSCPGWTVRDCVEHTAIVFRHKVAWLDIGRRPQPGEYERTPLPGTNVVTWYEDALSWLLNDLRARNPLAPADTWWDQDQTVGFWYRRMAQEVTVHRVDVEEALGQPTPIGRDIALDGIDEVLHVFLDEDWTSATAEEWGDLDPQAGAGQTVLVRSAGRAWTSTLAPDEVATATLRDGGMGTAADATVAGEPDDVLLWLWGRRPDEAVTFEGDRDLVATFRARLAMATQ